MYLAFVFTFFTVCFYLSTILLHEALSFDLACTIPGSTENYFLECHLIHQMILSKYTPGVVASVEVLTRGVCSHSPDACQWFQWSMLTLLGPHLLQSVLWTPCWLGKHLYYPEPSSGCRKVHLSIFASIKTLLTHQVQHM